MDGYNAVIARRLLHSLSIFDNYNIIFEYVNNFHNNAKQRYHITLEINEFNDSKH